ncbi:MAG: hypothetical protein AVO35_11350 [Candidatus Aegiribacteria sp. MLS_C]|nr:MAG: hypothetical protein AVO35_11350 [Candidatus Aegiribacteria sp. MLS_C]
MILAPLFLVIITACGDGGDAELSASPASEDIRIPLIVDPIGFALLGDGGICVIDPWRGGFLTWNADHSSQVSGLSAQTTPLLSAGDLTIPGSSPDRRVT